MDALETLSRIAVYPNGTGQPSVTGKAVDVAQGWPLPSDIDAAVKVGTSLVSVYAVPGTSSDPGQVFDWLPGTLTPSAPGLTADLEGRVLTFGGSPLVGDNVAVTASGKTYAYTIQANDTPQTVAAALASQIPGSSALGAVLTIAGYGITASVGASGILGERLYRQRMQFLLVVWAPNPSDRTVLAASIDVALKRNITIQMPDTSEVIVVHQGTRISDKSENVGEYRRDLMFQIIWDTIDSYPATEIIVSQPTFTGSVPTS